MASKATIGSLKIDLSLASAQFTKGLKTASSKMQKFGRATAKLGAALSVPAAGIAAMVKSNLSYADSMQKTADAVGVSTEAFSGLRHAAEMSGASSRDLENGLRRLARNAVDAPDKFKELGISVRKANGEMKPTEQLLGEVSDVLANMEPGAERTAAAFDLLGKSGTSLIPMLEGGEAGLKAMTDEAAKLGLVITDEQASHAVKFNDNMDRLKKSMSGIGIAISSELAEPLGQLTDWLVKMANKFSDLSPTTKKWLGIIAGATAVIGPVIATIGLLAMSFGPVVSGIGSAIVAVKALSVVLVSNPIGAAVAVIAGAAYLIYDNWEPLKAWFIRLWEGIKKPFNMFSTWLENTFGISMSTVVDVIKLPWEGLKLFYQEWWKAVSGFFTAAWNNVIKAITDKLGVTDDIVNAWNAVEEKLTRAVNAVKDAFKSLIEQVTEAIKKIKEFFQVKNKGEMSESYGADQNRGGFSGTGEFGDVSPTIAAPDPVGQGRSDGNDYESGVRESLEIKSPSGVMRRIGNFVSQGLGLGIKEGQPAVDSANDNVMSGIRSTFVDGFKDIVTGARSMKDVLIDVLNQIASKLAEMAGNQLFSSILGMIPGLGGDPLASALNAIPGVSAVPAFANGTRNFSGGLSMVGESGPELVNLGRGSSVYSNAETRRMLSGGNVTMVQVALSPDLEGRILSEAKEQSVQITKSGISQYDQNGASERIKQFQRDPRLKGR